MFRGVLASEMAAGFGDTEAAPETPRPPINEIQAQRANDIVAGMRGIHRWILLDQYYWHAIAEREAKRNGTPYERKLLYQMGQDAYSEKLSEAVRIFADQWGDNPQAFAITLKARGVSITQIAEVSGVSRPTVYKWLNGH